MNKQGLLKKLASWRVIDTYTAHELSKEMAREIIGLIQKKETEKKYLALAQNSSGIIPSKFEAARIRDFKFSLITTEGQIRKFFADNMQINPNDCFHPTILIAQDQNRTPKIHSCLMCGSTWGNLV